MTILRAVLFCLLALGASVVSSAQTNPTIPVKVTSPNGQIDLLLFDAGATDSQVDTSAPASEDLRYAIEFHGKRLMGTARLGLDLVGQPTLGPGMHLKSTQPESEDETYTIPVGRTRTVGNHYNGVRADISPNPFRFVFSVRVVNHVSPAEALRDQWSFGSLMHTFYAELAQSQAPVHPAPSLHDDEGYEDDDISDDDPDGVLPSET